MAKWSSEEDERVKAHYGRISQSEIAKKLGRTTSMIHNRVRTLGLAVCGTGRSPMSRKRRTYRANDYFFDGDDVLSAYWAGFIAADGCVSGNRLSIRVATKDGHHLDRFAKDIGFTGPVTRRMEKGGVVAAISLCSEHIVSALRLTYSITPRKSLTIKPPRISDAQRIKAFLIGLIDGDGCIRRVKTQTSARVIESPRLSVVSGSRAMILWVDHELGVMSDDSQSRIYQASGRRLWSYAVNGRQCLRVIAALRDVSVPRLTRKWGKLLNIPCWTPGYTTMGIQKLKPVRKLTPDAIVKITKLFGTGITNVEIGRRFGVTGARIGQLRRSRFGILEGYLKDSDEYVDTEESA